MTPHTARWFLATLLILLTLLRLCFIPQLELSPDEAYYLQWAQHLDWSYYSKGPGIAATIWLGTTTFGLGEFGIRCFAPLLALGTSLLIWALARRMFNEAVAFWTVLISTCTPIFWAGSLVMTIDPLSIFFWAAALLTLWLALEKAPAFSLWWFPSGMLIGLGFLCKYTNAFQLLSVALLFIVSRRLRVQFLRPGLWTMLGGFALTAWPPILWNIQNNWITLSHLKERGGLESGFKFDLGEAFEFGLLHLGVYSPLILIAILIATVKAWRPAWRDLKLRFLLVFSLPLILLYVTLSFREAGEANWTAPAFLSLSIIAAAYWLKRIRRSAPARLFCASALTLGALTSLTVLNTDLLRAIGIEWPYHRDPSGRLRGWASAAEALQKFRSALEAESGEPIFLIANRYQTAAALGYYLPEPRIDSPGAPPIFIPESQSIENQFSFWPGYDQFVEIDKNAPPPDPMFTQQRAFNPYEGRTALFITDNTEGMPPTAIMRGFEKIELAGEFDIFRRGITVKRWRVFLCWNYKTLPL